MTRFSRYNAVMNYWSRWLLLLMLTACGSSGSTDTGPVVENAEQHQLHKLKKSDLRIESASELHHFRVYLVQTPDEMRMGLMHVSKLPKDTGMLFAYGQNRRGSMWMKNTLIPLDILYIKQDGTIANIQKNATPLSLDSLPSEGMVFAALEINGGLTDALGIKVGDRVAHALFQ